METVNPSDLTDWLVDESAGFEGLGGVVEKRFLCPRAGRNKHRPSEMWIVGVYQEICCFTLTFKGSTAVFGAGFVGPKIP